MNLPIRTNVAVKKLSLEVLQESAMLSVKKICLNNFGMKGNSIVSLPSAFN